MENKLHTSNKFYKSYFIQDKGNSKNKAESRKIGLWFFTMYFDGWISFILSQNANHALISDHL